ncbi:hypothetical protein DQ04_02561060 [Trypanosoma grayi]|uniref:hypothetical protein n=1 Tax=Trypanosoma grayi TaxID=71804 RepID=UPI0004F47490|nr:hypothetical protein DQ04_02561060 [Trypanosoma grayi]KEG11499.1 hypothetical protein DQ04_02561060 [Trypanosoma grayi]
MGCGVSHMPHIDYEVKSLHAVEKVAPTNSDSGDKRHAEALHENGMSSERPSVASTTATGDSPSPRPISESRNEVVRLRLLRLEHANNNGGAEDDVGWQRSMSPTPGLSEYATLPLRHVHKKLKHNHRVFRICLTGGPCAGKSTFLTQLQAKMPERTGYKVYCVPEAATLLVTGGMVWDGDFAEQQQLALLRVQIALEDQFYNIAMASGKPSIVISDRGAMDGRAFCPEDTFARILERLSVTADMLRDRYDAVIHLVTAAAGAEEYYNLDNPARYESLEGAVDSDEKLRQVYIGHPMLRIVDNSTTFEEKMERGLALVGQVIGQKFSMQNTTYYLVRNCPKELPVKYATCTLTITLLCNSQLNDIRLIIKREQSSGECMYFFNSIRSASSTRRGSGSDGAEGSLAREMSPAAHHEDLQAVQNAFLWLEPGQRVKNEQRISSKEYSSLARHRDPQRRDVVLRAVQFIHNENRYEVTTIVEPMWAAGKQAMTLECDDNSQATFPSFVEVDREVPIDSLSTAFLISHVEMGPLYTSLAYAPVFTRGVAPPGAHADADNINASTRSSDPHAHKAEVGTEPKKKHKHSKHAKSKGAEEVAPLAPVPVNVSPAAASKKDNSKSASENIDEREAAMGRLKQPKLAPIKKWSESDDVVSIPTPPPSRPPTSNPRGAMLNVQ